MGGDQGLRRELAWRPCRARCSWRPTPRTGLFACSGCGSQWTPGVGWTPIDADGHVPAEVRAAAEAFSRGGAAGTAGS